jgi:hypothetical protein
MFYWTTYPSGRGLVTITALTAEKVEGEFWFTGALSPEFADPTNLRHVFSGSFSAKF